MKTGPRFTKESQWVKLSDEEKAAILSVAGASTHPQWRKRYRQSFAQHMASRPRGGWITGKMWFSWYNWPCGDEVLNDREQTVRRLVKAGKI